jgi:DNA segregation ATPase FtsK/SpoIIIE, S-DNA-T family
MAKAAARESAKSAGQTTQPVEDVPRLTLGREAATILVFTASVLTLLALFSYHPYDPGFLSEGTLTIAPRNWVGYLGSFWADLLVHLLGIAALWAPFLLIRSGYLILTRRPLLTAGRLLTWSSLFLSQAALLQILFGNVDLGLYGQTASTAMGGLAGIMLGEACESIFGAVGTLVFVPVWVLLTLMLLWRVSLLEQIKRLFAPIQGTWSAWKMRKERRKQDERREEARIQIRQRQQERLHQAAERSGAAEKAPAVKPRPSVTPALPLDPVPEGPYKLPPIDLLNPPKDKVPVDEKALMEKARQIEQRLAEFEVQGEVVEIHPGPVVTIFEYRPAPGIKYNRILGFADDLALTLKVDHIRMDRMSGKSTIGIEIPNDRRELISFRELLESKAYQQTPGRLPVALGKTVDGEPFVTSLDHMPHLLIAGTTGSGKSVGVNTLITSILYRSTPDEVKFIMIDPKQVELKIYEGIPHLLTPVVTDVKKAANALNWAVREMTERYKTLASAKVRNIEQYNQYVRTLTPNGIDEDLELTRPLPYIVIVIDELYDLMAVVAKDVETAIARLSAMARAVGIHLIMATQRPSRDVITGVIKSNLPARISFQVREKLESRLILDQNGAETLVGKGDMLYLPPATGRVMRLHGGFLSTVETQRVIQFLSGQGKPDFDTSVLQDPSGSGPDGDPAGPLAEAEDPLYRQAVEMVVTTGQASASNLQRKLRIGYARASRLLDVMEHRGIVGPVDGAKPREILMRPEELGT